ncbi:MAG: hypothetical protein ABI082_11850 [Dokdonella sp.]
MSPAPLRARLHDLWILYIAPWLPSWLPWSWAYACYRFLARFHHMFPEPTDAAAAIAPQYVPIKDIEAFKRDVRTVWLLDAVDLQLSRRRRTDWLPADIEVQGEWPTGAFVAVGFHYSTGLWMFRDLRRRGRDAVFIAARFDPNEYRHHPTRYRYGAARFAEVERISGQANAFRPGIRGKLLDALARGIPVVSLMDMPPRMAPYGQRPVQLLGRPASLPDGSVALAKDAGVPIVPYWVDINIGSGNRKLVIGNPLAAHPIDAVLAGIAGSLDELIRAEPAAWLFWSEWPAWQHDAAPLHALP